MKISKFHIFVAVVICTFLGAFSSCLYYSLDLTMEDSKRHSAEVGEWILRHDQWHGWTPAVKEPTPTHSDCQKSKEILGDIRAHVMKDLMGECGNYVSDGEMNDIVHSIQKYGKEYGIDPYLLLSIIMVESGCDPMARSPKGAKGLMQIREIAHRQYREHNGVGGPCPGLWDINHNIEVGAGYLSYLLEMYRNDVHRAVTAYNMGPTGAKSRHPHKHRYTRQVMANMEEFLNG